MKAKLVVWVVEEWNDRKKRFDPVSVHRTLREARDTYSKRKHFAELQVQSYLRADL